MSFSRLQLGQFVFFFAAACLLSACFGEVKKPTIKTNEAILSKTLDNGFTYHLFQAKNNQNEAKVSFRFLVNIGSFQEDDDQKGYAHFVEHLAFRDSQNFTYAQKQRHLLDGGLQFGRHSNAFTDYDKTLYFIDEINSTAARIETDLKLFKDVASGILFNEKDVDLERDIVIQELLLRQQKANGFQDEIDKLYDEKGILKAKRPIGTRPILEAATPQKLKQFYQKWYQPQFMHLVVAGNFDKQDMAQKIEAIFADLPKSNLTKTQKLQSNLPMGVSFIDHIEYSDNDIYLFIPLEADDYKLQTTDQFQQAIFNDFVIGGIDSQLHRINDAEGKKFSFLSTKLDWHRYKPFINVMIRHAENQRLEALDFIIQNLAKIRIEGFDKSQFDNQIGYIDGRAKNPLSPYHKNGDAAYIADHIYYEINGETPHIGQTLESDLAKYFISQATQENVKTHIQKLFGQQINMLVLTPNPVADGEREKLSSILDEFNKGQATAPTTTVPQNTNIMTQYNGEPGSIVEQKTIKGSEIKYLKLSNGMNVYLKQRSDDFGHINLTLMGKGGLEFLPATLIPASKIALQVLSNNGVGGLGQQQLMEYLNQNKIDIQPFVELARHGMKMNVQNKQDQEKAFNLLHQALLKPIVHEGQFSAAKQNFITQVEQYYNTPEGRYLVNSMNGVYTHGGDHLLVNLDVAKTMTSNDVLSVYEHLFADMSHLNLIIVGDFNQNIIENYLKKYIASLPTKNVERKQVILKTTQVDFDYRSTQAQKDQSAVELGFLNNKFDKKSENRDVLFVASSIMQKRLFEELRTKQGLVYGVSGGMVLVKNSANPAIFKIIFSALPQNEQKSLDIIHNVLNEVKTNGFSVQEFKTAIKEAQQAWRKFNSSNAGLAHLIAKNVINQELDAGYIQAENNLAKLTRETVNKMFNEFIENSVRTKLIFSNQ